MMASSSDYILVNILNHFCGEFPEEAFDRVKPRTGGRNEIQMESRVFGQAFLGIRCFMGQVIVHYQMKINALWGFLLILFRNFRKSVCRCFGMHLSTYLASYAVKM
jgi:hypothetical protein